MMQNRSNRNLLFGGRADAASTAAAPAPASSSELDAMEADNQGGVDALRGSAGMMKDLATHIERDVNDHNRMLDRMDKRFDGASASIGNTLARLNDLANDRGARRMALAVASFFFGLVVLYHLFKR